MARKVMQRNYDNEGNLISKECSKCHEIKSVSEFNKCKKRADGLQIKCKECFKKYNQENKESKKAYYQENRESKKEHIKEYKKIYNQENKDKIKEYNKKYWQENKDEIYEKNKKYAQENKDDINKKKKERRDKKIQEALQQIKIEVESNPDKYNYIDNKEIYGIIYLVHNIKSNKYYVGQTTVGFNNRYPSGWLYYHKNKELIKEDLQLYGENSFEYIKLFKVAYSQYELDKLEAYYINYYDSYENGYNENRGNIFTNRGKEK